MALTLVCFAAMLALARAGGQSMDSYNAPPKDIPKPQESSYGAKIPPSDIILPPPPKQSGYGGVPPPPADLPKKPEESPYGQQPLPKPLPPSDTGSSYGQKMPPPANPYGSFPSADIPSGVCSTSDRWLDVVGCYDCELKKCISECKAELPFEFGQCFNRTALFNLKTLFTDCLDGDRSHCHRLTDDMALAFLLAHYDQRILDVNRKDECIFRCGRPRVMNCMNMCGQLTTPDAIRQEPVVLCYEKLEPKISHMLLDFASCLDSYGAPAVGTMNN